MGTEIVSDLFAISKKVLVLFGALDEEEGAEHPHD